MPDLPVPPDFVPIVDAEHLESSPVCDPTAKQSQPCTTERRYPKRLNRRAPSRYTQ